MSKDAVVKDKAREEEKAAAKRERDEELTGINARYQLQLNDLRSQADQERQAVWAAWRERRNEQ